MRSGSKVETWGIDTASSRFRELVHMIRRGPAVALSLVLGAGALLSAPGAAVGDSGTAKDVDPCAPGKVKLKVDPVNDLFEVTGVIYSDDDDTWSWRFRHDGDISYQGESKADGDGVGKSFRVVKTMVNFPGAADYIVFRAENEHTGEVCRAELNY